MPEGLIGRKLGMTRIFGDDGSVVPVSVIEATPNTVTRLRTPERDGYAALQLGSGEARRPTKPVAGQFKHLAKERQRPRHVREVRLEAADGYEVGQQLDVTLFAAGDLVDVTGVSKGHGFTGVIARHGFRRGPKTHGSDHHRAPGSIGAGTYPGRVWECSHLGGHRFAPNLVCLPDGLWFGRSEAAVAAEYERGRVALEHLRGRSSFPATVQAADHFVREREGLRGVDDLTVEAHAGDEVTLRGTDGRRFHVRLRQDLADSPRPLSCGDEKHDRPVVWSLVEMAS